jgi:hypothetical protein
MREIRALVWKEWHETRLFLWIAWGLFIGLPIAAGIETRAMTMHPFAFIASPWILFCGPLLAIVVGVAMTCRDLQGSLEEFWESRPIGGTRMFAVKFVVAFAVVFTSCGVPLAIEMVSNRDTGMAWFALSMTFLWMALLAIAFACGCVFRKPAHAAAVAILGMMLICFLPVLIEPLARFNVFQLWELLDEQSEGIKIDWRGPLSAMATGMLAITAVATAIGLLSVRFHWHVESGRRLIYVTIASALFVLLGSWVYQVGTNLPVISSIPLGINDQVRWIDSSVNPPLVCVRNRPAQGRYQYSVHQLIMTDHSLSLGSIASRSMISPQWDPVRCASQRDPSAVYELEWSGDGDFSVQGNRILQVDHQKELGVRGPNPLSIVLWHQMTPPTAKFPGAYLYQYADRLYVLGDRTIVYDISDPVRPRQLSNEAVSWKPIGQEIDWGIEILPDSPSFELPYAPGLPKENRLELLMGVRSLVTGGAFDGKTWCRYAWNGDRSTLDVLRIGSLTDDRVDFELAGRFVPTRIQELSLGIGSSNMRLENGLLYALSPGAAEGSLAVFDVALPRAVKLVAHFAAPSLFYCEPLPDGRAIAGGDQLWLLGPPPKH